MLPPVGPLRPVNPGNARDLRLTATAGTKLVVPYSWGTVNPAQKCTGLHPPQKAFTPRRASSATRCRWVRLSPIAQDSRLLPPVGVGPVSQCPWRGTPSQAPYRS
jgi:hypothetical protein